MKDDKVTTASCFGQIILVLILFPVSAFIRAWAIATLWAWFIVPAFGVQELSYKTALGLGLVAAIIHPMESPTSNEEKTTTQRWGEAFGRGIVVPLILVLLGRIYLWMF